MEAAITPLVAELATTRRTVQEQAETIGRQGPQSWSGGFHYRGAQQRPGEPVQRPKWHLRLGELPVSVCCLL